VTPPSAPRILVAEDNDVLRRGIARALREAWGEVDEAATGTEAVARIRDATRDPYQAVVTDLRLPEVDGLAVLRASRDRDPRTSVLVMTAYGSIEMAVQAIKEGAFDFVQKPMDLEQLEVRVARCVERWRLLGEGGEPRAANEAREKPDPIVGESPALRAVIELAQRVAATRSTVLVTGETGTGKELLAGLLHRASPRCAGPFVKVNCAALPETLLESELFGHERGAFTGADRLRIGRFEQASGGTILLDEIGDMAPTTQAKLLRVLQDREFQRLGGTRPIRADVRIVAATNQALEAEVRAGRFREDLYFRLNVIRIHLPPLRERREDLEALAAHYLAQFSRDLGRPLRRFGESALASIHSYPWPGNVRELRNVIERAVLLADGEQIDAADLELTEGVAEPRGGSAGPALATLRLAEVERAVVLEALHRSAFVQKDAAARLGVSRRKLNYMIQRMGITHPSWRRNRAPGEGAEAPEESP
jgi:two-component system response regulator HydG